MADLGKVEYRVRKITRYTVTRYYESASSSPSTDGDGRVDEKGEYDNANIAYEVAYALCKAEHERYGLTPGDERIIYPTHPDKDEGQGQGAYNQRMSQPIRQPTILRG